jgi:hypothetical protein
VKDIFQKEKLWRSIGQKARWLASALFFPFFPVTWPKLGVFMAAWWIVQPAATMLFPRAEKVLEEEGLHSEIVQELAPGKKVYIRKDDFWGKAHVVFDRNPFYAPFDYWQYIGKSSRFAAFAVPSVSFAFNDVCAVYMKPTPEFKEYNLSSQDIYKMTLLHEIRHCSGENKVLEAGVLQEGDSDFHSVEAFAQAMNRPEIKENFLHYRAGALHSNSHDTALYLDAKFHRVAVPSKKEMDEVSSLFKKVIMDENIKISRDCKHDHVPETCEYEINGQRVSSLTGRRFALLFEAQEAVDKKKAVPTKPLS